jgi:hypothetical protein
MTPSCERIGAICSSEADVSCAEAAIAAVVADAPLI